MTARLAERRSFYRVRTALPVSLEGAKGVMRDMSTSGAYFWIDGTHAPGESINFSIHLQSAEGETVWNCRGNVIRIEPRDSNTGVAVKITDTTVDPVQRRVQSLDDSE